MAKPFWNQGIRFQCQGSGKCCVSRGDYGYVYLTLEDRRRLAKYLKLKTQQFTRKYCSQKEGYYYLKNEAKECRYLKGTQCGVYKARPIQCRTWPFWPENLKAKNWTGIKKYCPGVGKGKLYSKNEIEQILTELEE